MPRPRKISETVAEVVIGVAAHASIEVRKRGRAPTQGTIERAMRNYARDHGSRDHQKAVELWFEIYRRSSRYVQLSRWQYVEPVRARPAGTAGARTQPRDPVSTHKTLPPLPTLLAEEGSQGRWTTWQTMDPDRRKAFIGFVLEQEQLAGGCVLRRLGPVGISRFYDSVISGNYTGVGYGPHAEIALFAQARSRGVLELTTADEMRLARRVYLTWKGWRSGGLALVFWDGSSAPRALGRLRACRRVLSWAVPLLA